MNTILPQWRSVQQVAQALDVCERTGYNMIKRDEVRHKRVGRLIRVHVSAIEEEDTWDLSSKGKVLKAPFGTSSTPSPESKRRLSLP